MKNLLLILFLTGLCFAENFICFVDKTTLKVADVYIDTPKNRITYNSNVKPTQEIRYFVANVSPNFKNKIWNGTTVVNDDAEDLADIEYTKDINNVDKLQKAGFLVIMDYLRSMGLSKTNVQFKNDVKTKYESLT